MLEVLQNEVIENQVVLFWSLIITVCNPDYEIQRQELESRIRIVCERDSEKNR
jgi:hypothetical protein